MMEYSATYDDPVFFLDNTGKKVDFDETSNNDRLFCPYCKDECKFIAVGPGSFVWQCGCQPE